MFQFCFFISIAYSYCVETKPVPPVVRPTNFIGQYYTTGYYTPVAGQNRYYSGSFEKDLKMNCSGDCLVTANGHRLQPGEEYRAFACPKNIKLGTRLRVEGIGTGYCYDRGGSIGKMRLDIWKGIGDEGLDNIYSQERKDGFYSVYYAE